MESIILFGLVLSLLFLGVPIAVSLGLSSIIVIAFFSTDSMSSVALQLFTASQNYTLLAIPFFILASSFMATGGVAKRIIRFAIASVGHFRGGLAMAAVLACMLFAALSGSSPATVVAIGTIAIAGMALGVDPVHLGIIMVVNMEIGMITPPIGLNLFVTSGITNMSLVQVVMASLPFVAVLFAFLILVTYVPILSTWLPYTLMGPEIITR